MQFIDDVLLAKDPNLQNFYHPRTVWTQKLPFSFLTRAPRAAKVDHEGLLRRLYLQEAKRALGF